MWSWIISSAWIAYLIAFSFGAFLGRGVSILLIFALANMLIEQSFAWFNEFDSNYYTLGSWFQMGGFWVSFGWMIDSLTLTMFLVVTVVSTLVHIYSTGYMGSDPYLPKFMSYLTLFTAFMLLLVSADNLVQLFIGWEGVGLCSFLLISFWYTRLGANKAAIKAMLVNRVGDAGLLFGMSLCYAIFRTVDFDIISCLLLDKDYQILINFLGSEFNALEIICAALLIGAIGKSAQIGLHIWLPDAMEGPTPVSALIHAATMVTAGVFLVIRCSTWFESAPNILIVMCYIGGWTALFAGSCGIAQHDMKKIIAYSTCSQLGYMFVCCGLSQYNLALFHLFTHAFFKALLFLSAGVVIHGFGGEQDLRKMGGAIHNMPIAYIMILIGSLALMGFPFLSGFYSKDVILEVSQVLPISLPAYISCVIAAIFTTIYSLRLLYYGFLTQINSYRPYIYLLHENPKAMIFPLLVLFIATLGAGFVFSERIIGLGSDWLSPYTTVLSDNILIINSEFLDIKNKTLPLILVTLTTWIYFMWPTNKWNVQQFFIFKTLNNSWYYNKVYMYLFVIKVMQFIWFVCMIVWNTFFYAFEQFVIKSTYTFSNILTGFHTGNVKDYYNIVAGAVFLILIFLVLYF